MPSGEGGYVVRLNECGDTLWHMAYDYSPLGGDGGNSLIQLNDSAYMICGSHYDSLEGASDSYLFKLDASGDSVWYQPVDAGLNDRGISHFTTNDGGYVIGGYFNTNAAVFLLKTDSLGSIEWQQQYEDSTYLYGLDQTPDGGYIISGEILRAAGDWDLFLTKTDSAGNEQWTKYYGDNYDQYRGTVVSTLDTGYVIVGYTVLASGDRYGYIIKCDSSGTVLWEKTYGFPNYWSLFKFVRQLPDGSYIVAGGLNDSNYSPPPPRVWLLKLSSLGDTLWTKTYTYYAGTTHTYVEDLIIANDGGYVMTGYIINNSLPAKNDLWMLKTDAEGNTCNIDTLSIGCSEYYCYAAVSASAYTIYLPGSNTVNFSGSGLNPTSWYWDFGDGTTDTTENPTHSFDSVGLYTVTFVADNDTCSDTAYVVINVVNFVGLNEIVISGLELEVYPNPTDDLIHIKNIPYDEQYRIKVYNLMGELMFSQALNNKNNSAINLAGLANGLYLLVVEQRNSVFRTTFIKY